MRIEDVKNVTVAGGGTQGSQIASMAAYKGFNITTENSPTSLGGEINRSFYN